MVLRNAQGRFSLATPGFDDACEVATTFISLATGTVTSAALLVSGPAIARTLSSPASLRSAFVACAGRVASSTMTILRFAPLTPPASLTCFSSISSVTVLARPHSAKGPLLGTIAPSTISRPLRSCAELPSIANPTIAAATTTPAATIGPVNFEVITDLLLTCGTPPRLRGKPAQIPSIPRASRAYTPRPISAQHQFPTRAARFKLAPVSKLEKLRFLCNSQSHCTRANEEARRRRWNANSATLLCSRWRRTRQSFEKRPLTLDDRWLSHRSRP